MAETAERAYFLLCLALGRLLGSVRYAKARTVSREVRKHRAFYAPLLIRMVGPLVTLLDAGVRFLPQREWEERERRLYRSLHGASIEVAAGGVLVLPRLPGATLAALLQDPARDEPSRRRAIALAAAALADLHRLGFTHADAMAENVMVDLDAGTAHWFDFETVHDERRDVPWRRADDLRALLASCLVRTAPRELEPTLMLLLDAYADEGVALLLPASFTSAWQRPLLYHLSQAGLSFRHFREIDRLLRKRVGA